MSYLYRQQFDTVMALHVPAYISSLSGTYECVHALNLQRLFTIASQHKPGVT